MTPRFDQDVVLAKVATIRKCVATVRGLWGGDGANIPDWIQLDVTVLNLQRAVEGCLDLAHHLLAANEWGLPGSGSEAFVLLHRQGVVPHDDLSVLQRMVGFRNIAVHNYTEIEETIVRAIVRDHLADLERFADQVLQATLKADKRTSATEL